MEKSDVGNFYGFIQRLEKDKLIGWFGSTQQSISEVEIYLYDFKIGSAKRNIGNCTYLEERNGIEGCWFELIVDPMNIISLCAENKEMIFHMKVNNVLLEKEASSYHFSFDEWLKYIDTFFTQKDFLYLFPFFGSGLENELSVMHLCNALQWLQDYGLYNTQAETKSYFLNALTEKKFVDISDSESFYALLIANHDLIQYFLKQMDTLDNSIIEVVNKSIANISTQDALKMIETCNKGTKEKLNTIDVDTKNKNDLLLFDLLKDPDAVIKKWKTYSAEERIKNAFSFMNLLHLNNAYSYFKKLNLSQDELYVISNLKDEERRGETLAETLFMQGNHWEGMLVTVYQVSLETNIKQLFIHLKNIIKYSNQFHYIDTAVFSWLLLDQLLEKQYRPFNRVKKLLEPFWLTIDEKNLLDDAIIKKINLSYIHELLLLREENFLEKYKTCLNYYLLDKSFQLNEALLSEKYLDKVLLAWVKNIEELRCEAIKYLGDEEREKQLLYHLDLLMEHANDLVGKVQYTVCKNILNISNNKEQITDAAFSIMKVGGTYDKILASEILGKKTLQVYHETNLIESTKKWTASSPNNYWYKQALRNRVKPQSEQKEFLETLFTELGNSIDKKKNKLRLIRLLLSEILWYIQSGITSKTFKIKNLMLNDILNECIKMEESSREYVAVFTLYLYLLDHDNTDFSLDDDQLLGKEISIENIDEKTRDILKLNKNRPMKVSEVKAHIVEKMLYPYTLVMVYSCQDYIPTRQKVIRETWLQRAKALGISCKFVVGGSETSFVKDDMIFLDVEDTYERLPQKSVEMFRFVSQHFSYERFMKIDDDCLLNIDAYFSDDKLFDTDYYGRFIERNIGGTDRVWHQKKSQSKSAQSAIDLSPEPSYYTDGSTGYVLSQYACEKLIQAYDEPVNKMLVKHSFLEDKLVGDLLTLQNIKINATNITTLVYRKVANEIEATFWEYNILPTKENALKVLHCETEKVLKDVWNHFNEGDHTIIQKQYFSNRKIDNFFGVYNEQPFVEEVKILNKKLRKAKHVAIIVCQNELAYLPALLAHHRSIGIEHFIYIDNISSDDSLTYMMEQKDVSVFVSTQEYKNFRYSVDWIEAVLSNFCYGKWVLVVDADELFVYDEYENNPISSLTKYADKNGYDAFLAPMIDMYNKGPLSEAQIVNKVPYEVCNYFDDISSMDIQRKNNNGPFSNGPMYSAGLRARVFGRYNPAPMHSYINQKYCLFKYKPIHRFVEGIHFMGNIKPAPLRTALLHFKYHAGFYEKVVKQIESGQHWNGSQEYKRYLNKLEQNRELSLFDENISRKYTGSKSLIEAGYMDEIE